MLLTEKEDGYPCYTNLYKDELPSFSIAKDKIKEKRCKIKVNKEDCVHKLRSMNTNNVYVFISYNIIKMSMFIYGI